MINYEELGALKVRLVELEAEVARLTDIEQQFRNIKQQLDIVMLDRARLRFRVDEYINRNQQLWEREEALTKRLAEIDKMSEEVNGRQQATRAAMLRAQHVTSCLQTIFGEANFSELLAGGNAIIEAKKAAEQQAHAEREEEAERAKKI